MKTEINVGRDFSPVPAGRRKEDGPFSGESFRERFLTDAIRNNVKVTVDLSGTEGYGSSFLEEAFGGLVRELGLPAHKIRSLLKLETKDPRFRSYVDEAYSYLDRANEQDDATERT
jgi:hypothetical protein